VVIFVLVENARQIARIVLNPDWLGGPVPHHAETQIRQGVEAWAQLQNRLRELAALNRERLIPVKPKK
jgi:hypothetical protein